MSAKSACFEIYLEATFSVRHEGPLGGTHYARHPKFEHLPPNWPALSILLLLKGWKQSHVKDGLTVQCNKSHWELRTL